MVLLTKKDDEPDVHYIQPWEEFWVTHQPFLLERGYRLPDRYDPNWVPSWHKPQEGSAKKINPIWCPDSSCMSPRHPIIDAFRVFDGVKVALKLVDVVRDIPILEYLASPALLADPRNHTVPILDKIVVPDDEGLAWIVMPLLLSFDHSSFPFKYVSEVIEFTSQFLEGLELMHEHGIAHRDACYLNLMVDSQKLIPDGNFSFSHSHRTADWKTYLDPVERRSVMPLKYYFIDFETACQYPPEEKNPVCVGIFGQERDIPEMSETVPYNPFKLDIFQLGMIFPPLFEDYEGMEFLIPLYEAMTHPDPEQRPTAAEAHQLFRAIISLFTEADMSRRVWWKQKRRRELPSRKRTFRTWIVRFFCFIS